MGSGVGKIHAPTAENIQVRVRIKGEGFKGGKDDHWQRLRVVSRP
jgi:hypothetical protein